jgi:hypothetical protein
VTLEAGEYDFRTEAAVDECLGGALEALFMPEGPETPHAFAYPIYIPGQDELPATYDIDLRAPFIGMPVTVEDAGQGALAVRGAVMESVLLDEVRYGDCAATMTVDIDLYPLTSTTLDGQARLEVSDARGAEELCPVFAADPCQVTLAVAAERP